MTGPDPSTDALGTTKEGLGNLKAPHERRRGSSAERILRGIDLDSQISGDEIMAVRYVIVQLRD